MKPLKLMMPGRISCEKQKLNQKCYRKYENTVYVQRKFKREIRQRVLPSFALDLSLKPMKLFRMFTRSVLENKETLKSLSKEDKRQETY